MSRPRGSAGVTPPPRLREGVFLEDSIPEAAVKDALRRGADLHSGPAEDLAAFGKFAEDMRKPFNSQGNG
jgi:hypothetical protein